MWNSLQYRRRRVHHGRARLEASPDAPDSGYRDGGRAETKVVLFRKIRNAESHEAYDLAVLWAPPYGKTFQWSTRPLALLDVVQTFGYPYGLDPETEQLNVRGFRGEIVGGDTLIQLPARPSGIELSFLCPRGLSGAPLILSSRLGPRIIGVILSNRITEMVVYREEEKLVEHGKESTLLKTEAHHLGLAIRANVVLGIQSAMLGCTIGDWVKKYGLLEEDSP